VEGKGGGKKRKRENKYRCVGSGGKRGGQDVDILGNRYEYEKMYGRERVNRKVCNKLSFLP
jgi:hypothetical protein